MRIVVEYLDLDSRDWLRSAFAVVLAIRGHMHVHAERATASVVQHRAREPTVGRRQIAVRQGG